MKNARILFVTTKQPSTNPRMRKAAETLAREGFPVRVLYAHGVRWALHSDEAIFRDSPCNWLQIGGDRDHKPFIYFISRLERKVWEWLGNEKHSLCRSYRAYVREGIKWQPDLIIGHNPGALGPLVEIGKKLNAPTMFDAEDFHRGEFNPDYESIQGKKIAKLEHECLPQLTAATGASPLIVEAYRQLFPHIPWTTVNNAFPSALMQSEPLPQTGPLRLVWFSQVVGLDRGLAEFLRGMALAPEVPINLVIIGMATEELKSYLVSEIQSEHHHIYFKGPFAEPELFQEIGNHEIGLALEVPKTINREICRTNKLYTYPLCGVHMLVSKTEAQIDFLLEYPNAGELIDLEKPASIANALNTAYHNREELLQKRKAAWELGKKTLNWERESRSLINLVQKTFGDG